MIKLSVTCIGPLPPTIHRGLEWPQFLNSLIVCSLIVCLLVCSLQILYFFTNHSGLILHKKIRKFAHREQTHREQTNTQRIQKLRPL